MAKIACLPTGTVTFTDALAGSGAGATLGTAQVTASGTATLTINTLTAGKHAIVANYSGDANFATSAAQAVTIFIGDFSFSLNPPMVNVTDGQRSTAITLTYSGTEYLNSSLGVQLSCLGLPPGAACNFSATSIQPLRNANGTTTGTATLTITALGPILQQSLLKRGRKPWGGSSGIPMSLAGLLALGLPFAWRKRKLFGLLLGLALLPVFVSFNGCGYTPRTFIQNSPGTPPGTSTVTVSATVTDGPNATLTHTATITLNVSAEGTPTS